MNELTAEHLLALTAALDGWRKGGPWPGMTELVRVTGLPVAAVRSAVDALEVYPRMDPTARRAAVPARHVEHLAARRRRRDA